MGWWVADYWNTDKVLLLSWVFWVIFSITLHELAHGWAALRQGDDTPRATGHMTLNPYVHMGPIALIVFAVIGITWGAMPVDPSRFRDGRLGRAIVAAAGPAMNLGLAVIAIVGLAAIFVVQAKTSGTGSTSPLVDNLGTFFLVGGMLNIVLALFNLMPAPPLDGSQILAGFSWKFYELIHHPNASFGGLILLMVMFWTGIFDFLFVVGREATAIPAALLAAPFI